MSGSPTASTTLGQDVRYLSGGNEVPIMDTYARALFQAGKRTEAIELEKKAIAACKDTRFRPELESVLMRFERLSREKPLKK